MMATPMRSRTSGPAKRPTVFGANMRRLRTSRGWTQDELAMRAKLSRSTIAKHENGDFQAYDDETVMVVASALEVDRTELFTNPNTWGAIYLRSDEPPAPYGTLPAGTLPAGLEAYLKERGYDLTSREIDELKTFGFRLKRGAVPGPDFWERILAALRSLPPE